MIKKRGFTLIEMLVTIVIMGLMASGLFAMMIFGWKAVGDMGNQRRQVDDLRYFSQRIEKDLRGITKHGFISSGSDIKFFVWKNYPAPNAAYYLCRYAREGSQIIYTEQRADTGTWGSGIVVLPTGTPAGKREVVLSGINTFTVSPAINSAAIPLTMPNIQGAVGSAGFVKGETRAGNQLTFAQQFRLITIEVEHVQDFKEGADMTRKIQIRVAPRNLVYFAQQGEHTGQYFAPNGTTLRDYDLQDNDGSGVVVDIIKE